MLLYLGLLHVWRCGRLRLLFPGVPYLEVGEHMWLKNSRYATCNWCRRA